MVRKKRVIGLVEKIELIGEKTVKTYALFDTGASFTSVDTKLASRAKLGPVVRTTKIKNPSIKARIYRPVVSGKIKIKGRKFDAEVNLQDRSHMTFPIIIGRDILTGNFIVDVDRNRELVKKFKIKNEYNEWKGQKQLKSFVRNGR